MSSVFAKSLSALVSAWEGTWVDAPESVTDTIVTGVCQDSRLCAAGDAYFALTGASNHGYEFALSAVKNGATAVLVSPDVATQYDGITQQLKSSAIPVIGIVELDQKVSGLAAEFYGHPSKQLTVVAVTGTDGKTSVCQFVKEALSLAGTLCGYIGTLGWGVEGVEGSTALTTPDSVAMQRILAAMHEAGAKVVALEASSHGIATGRLNDVHVDVAVLTNLGRDHLDFHETEEAYAEAKADLFRWPSLKAIVVNGDDALGQSLIKEISANESVDVHVFSNQVSVCQSASAQSAKAYKSDNILLSRAGLQFDLSDGDETFEVVTPLYGRFNVENLSACYAVLRACGFAANDSVDSLAQLGRVPGRMEPFTEFARPMVVVDYAHTPQALGAAIKAVREHARGEVWVVFGCGGDRDPGKRVLMAQAAETADHVILTDDNPRTENAAHIRLMIVHGFSAPSVPLEIGDRKRAIQFAIWHAQPDDVVLVAGKGHEDYQIVGNQVLDFSDRDVVQTLLKEVV